MKRKNSKKNEVNDGSIMTKIFTGIIVGLRVLTTSSMPSCPNEFDPDIYNLSLSSMF